MKYKTENVTPIEIQQLNDIHSRVKASQSTFDVDSLMHVHQTQLQQERRTHWCMVIFSSFIATSIIFILCYFIYSFWYTTYIMTKLEAKPKPIETEPVPQQLQSREQMHGQRVTFSPCPMQRTV
jgi:type IV secretory pathway component VirB8